MSIQQTSNQALAVCFSQRLQSIEQAMMVRDLDPNNPLLTGQSSSSLPQCQLEPGIAPTFFPLIEGLHHLVESSSFYDVNHASLTNDILLERHSQDRPRSINQKIARSSGTFDSRPPSPASIFELSPSFWPETYIITDGVPKLFSYMTYQEGATDFTRVNRYAIFYAKGPRQWVRITASVTFSVDSLLWDCERVATSSGFAYELPGGLESLLKGFLMSHPNLEQDTQLKVYLGSQVDVEGVNGALKTQVRITRPVFEAMAYLKMKTSMLYHSNCPRYSEKELVQIPLRIRRYGRCFISYLQPRWVFDYRFGSSREQIDSVLYHLQVLHCLRGSSRICPFIGVVIDEEAGVVKSFLAEMPAKGSLSGMILHNTDLGTPISLERRVRWCKEIIEAVAQVHEKGFVVGNLGDYFKNDIAIDGEDSAVLVRFEKSFKYDSIDCTGLLPPEYLPKQAIGGKISATPHTDIYQLGLLLWWIASQTGSRRLFCEFFGWPAEENTFCIKSHTDSIQLPPLGELVPQYLKDVIAACRTENPYHRPAAWELLEMFPQDAKATMITDSGRFDADFDQALLKRPPKMLIRRLDEVHETCTPRVVCDLCGKVATKHYFHCSICVSADFDICPQCFAEGGHCLEPDHYLREFRDWNQINVYTNMKENGRREIVVL
jgi:hypothetical protein